MARPERLVDWQQQPILRSAGRLRISSPRTSSSAACRQLIYAVSRRTRELGVRLAFGAQRGSLLRMVLGDALKLAGFGLALGVPLALLSSSSLAAFLFDVTPMDPAAFAGAAIVLTGSVLVAAYIPARRAAAVDPIRALREE